MLGTTKLFFGMGGDLAWIFGLSVSEAETPGMTDVDYLSECT